MHIGVTSVLNYIRISPLTLYFGLLQQPALFRAFPFNIRSTVIGESGFAFYSSKPRYTFNA